MQTPAMSKESSKNPVSRTAKESLLHWDGVYYFYILLGEWTQTDSIWTKEQSNSTGNMVI